MNVALQRLAKNYYENRTVKNFNEYYNQYKGIAQAAAASILRDSQQAYEVVNDLFTKFYNREDEDFQFDNSKSHLGYVWHSASNLAKIKWNKNRIKINNIQNCDSRAEYLELEYMAEILINESENIKVSLGFSRKDHMKFDSVFDFYSDKHEYYKKQEESEVCKESDLEEIDAFMDDFGCITTAINRIRKALKLKKDADITYGDLLAYAIMSLGKLERIAEIKQAKSLEEIKKIKSKHTRKKIGKILFENTKQSLLLLEAEFKTDQETGDTLEHLGYVNGGNYTMDSELGDINDVIFGAGDIQYSIEAQLELARKLINDNEDKENPGLLKRVLIDNHEFKSVLENIIHIIKMGDKDDEGYTMNDLEFCKELVLSIGSIPSITKSTKKLNPKSCKTQEDRKAFLEELRSIITYHTQLKCSKDEFGFDSVGAIKSRSHRYRKFFKEEFERKMIISEIRENKLHRISGEVVYKYEDTGVIKIKCNYKHGVLHGSFKTFYKNGNKHSAKIYKNGKLDGDYREWHDNGKQKIHGEYSNGIKVGAWYVYREDGSKDELAIIGVDGSKLYELYDKNGNVSGTGMIRANG